MTGKAGLYCTREGPLRAGAAHADAIQVTAAGTLR